MWDGIGTALQTALQAALRAALKIMFLAALTTIAIFWAKLKSLFSKIRNNFIAGIVVLIPIGIKNNFILITPPPGLLEL